MENYKKQVILEKALSDPTRKKYGLNILFADKSKKPLQKNWDRWIDKKQTDDDIKAMYKPAHTNYGYLTGFNGLVSIDFDASWIYLEALDYFKDRLNTFTVETPNGGYHAYYLVNHPETNIKYKKSLHVEVLARMNTIVYGEAQNLEGKMVRYNPTNDEPIIRDDNIMADMNTFLRETLTKFDFLSYKCIKEKLSAKVNYMTHEQRLDLATLFVKKGDNLTTAINFFRVCTDFDAKITKAQVERTKKKIDDGELDYPTCDTLAEHFDWDKKHCNKCIRLLKKEKKPKKKSSKNDVVQMTLKRVLKENRNVKPFLNTGLGNDPELGLYYGTVAPVGDKKIPVMLSREKGIVAIKVSDLDGADPPKDKRITKEPCKMLSDRTHSAILDLLHEIDKSNEIGYEKISTVFNELNSIVRKYLYLEKDAEYYVIILWIMATYFRMMFTWQGYLIFYGMRDVGKSTALSLLSHACFNGSGTISGNKSESNLMRLAGGTHGLIIVDHYEEVKKNQFKNQTYVEFMENAWYKNSTYERQSTYDPNIEETFNIASSVAVGTRTLNDTLQEKGIIITMVESNDPQYQHKSAKMDEDPKFQDMQKNMIAMALNYQDEVIDAYDNIEVVGGLGREFNKVRGMLALAKVVDQENGSQFNLYDALLNFARNQRAKRKTESNETEDALLRVIIEKTEDKWTYRELAEAMVAEGFDWYKWQTAKSELDKLQVVKKRNTAKRPVVITIDYERAEERAKQRGIKSNDSPSVAEKKVIDDIIDFCSESEQQDSKGAVELQKVLEVIEAVHDLSKNNTSVIIDSLRKKNILEEPKSGFIRITNQKLISKTFGAFDNILST